MSKRKKTFFQSIFTSRELISSVNIDETVDENVEKQMLELLRKNNTNEDDNEDDYGDEYGDILQLLNKSAIDTKHNVTEEFDANKNSSLIDKLKSDSPIVSFGIDIDDDDDDGGFNAADKSILENKSVDGLDNLDKTVIFNTSNLDDLDNLDKTVVFNSNELKKQVETLEKKSTNKQIEENSDVDIPLM